MRLKPIGLFLAVGLTSSLVACTTSAPDVSDAESPAVQTEAAGGEGGEGGTVDLAWSGEFADREVIAGFTNRVVVPKYEQFEAAAQELATSLDQFANAPSEASLTAAREAWLEARSVWERTESFAFGPAGSLGYDAALDTWPVNETDIQQVLASDEPLTAEQVAQLPDSQKGMHTIEYLLFGLENDKSLDQFSDRDRAYLQALGQDLSRVSSALLESWQVGINGQPPYREVIAQAGENNTVYPTLPAGAQEMVTGLIESLNEVAAEKIGVPLEEQDPVNLESRFSHNTLADLKNNVIGARAVYYGQAGAETAAADSLSRYVAQRDAAADEQIQAEFEAAIAALEAVPAPLEESVTDPDAAPALQQAQDAVLALQETLETQLVPLI
ncbi:peptidase M75 [Romeria aff. gracilis LEGE 07310]|uniref:Peptidase M75 n=1 Tax=Vasconcelosia minhoensis LEGE 07310 TaxID=915328 RepID=A0A8J7ALT6_9CYAN|nr:imelysin family protein [Romeria gracilis]MBE9077355.1 peptidase M75 [Romeria aff. gracilis LEGE 07310]